VLMVSAEADVVYQAYEMRNQGESQGSISAGINSKEFRTRTGQMFTEYSGRDILSNRFYAGVVVYQGQECPGQHQAIIPEPLYQQVQAVWGFYAWQYSGCPMKAGHLSESGRI